METAKLRKLSRAELLQMLVQISEDNERLTRENEELNAKINSREIQLQKAGSIAEASLAIHEVMIHAQQAANQYQENIKRLSDDSLKNTKHYCQQMIQDAEKKCSAMQETEEAQWQRTKARLDQYIKTHANWQKELQEKIRDDEFK